MNAVAIEICSIKKGLLGEQAKLVYADQSKKLNLQWIHLDGIYLIFFKLNQIYNQQ